MCLPASRAADVINLSVCHGVRFYYEAANPAFIYRLRVPGASQNYAERKDKSRRQRRMRRFTWDIGRRDTELACMSSLYSLTATDSHLTINPAT